MDGSLAALFSAYLAAQQPGGLQMGPQGAAGLPGGAGSALPVPGPQPGMPGYPQAGAPVGAGGLPNAANMPPGPPPSIPQVPGMTGTGPKPGMPPSQGGSQWKRPLNQQFQQ